VPDGSHASQIRSKRGTERVRAPDAAPRRAVSLRARVIAGYLLMLALFAVVFATVLVQLQRLQTDLQLLSEGYLPLAQELAGVSSWSPEQSTADSAVDRLYRERRVDAWIFKRIEGHLARSQEIADGMLLRPISEDDLAALRFVSAQLDLALDVADKLQDTHALFVQAFEESMELDGIDDFGKARRFVPELQDYERQLDINLRILNKRLARRVSRVVERTRRTQKDAAVVAASVSAVAFAVGLLLLLATHFALRPIRRLITGAERIRAGRFDERVPEESRDEIGRLARSFNAMAASIEEREHSLEQRSVQLEQALADLRASQDRMIRSERLAAIGHLAAQIAHEVRNPLNALGLNADALGDEIRDGNVGDAEELLGAIRDEIRRLTSITESYLEVGRLPPLKLARQALGPVVADIVRFHQEDLEFQGLAVEVDIGDLPDVHLDADQLRQALLNILRNAAEALVEEGGGTLQIAARREGEHALITIRDDGPGMDAEHVARIFDPFFSTKDAGSGLGLPLTQQVIVEHRGRITCISQPGEGTTFSIRLPAAPAESPARDE